MTLLDLTRELFTYLVVFRQRAVSHAPPSLAAVEEDLEAIFQTMEERAREHPLLRGPYGQVRYGLAALSDEILLTSGWPQAVDWAVEPLEERLYGSRQGGTRFFQILEGQVNAPKDVLAIYYLCLGLGFCGHYTPDDPLLARVKADLLARIRPPQAPTPAPLSRHRPPLTPAPEPESEPEPEPEPSAEPPAPAPSAAAETPPAPEPESEPEPEPELEPEAASPEPVLPPPPRPLARRAAPPPPGSRSWLAGLLALGVVGVAVALIWVVMAPWPASPPPRNLRPLEQTAPPPSVTTVARAPSAPAPASPAEPAPQEQAPAKPATAPQAEPAPAMAVALAPAPTPAPAPAPQDASPAPTPAPEPTPEPGAPQAEPGVYLLHAGLYVGPIQSGRLATRLQQAGLPAFVRQEVRSQGRLRYLVLVGPFYQEAQAQQALQKIEQRFKIKPFFVEPAPPPASSAAPAGPGPGQ
ncbi:MAG: DotU/TssL family secretion system protein [Pseudomonadota bacterium]